MNSKIQAISSFLIERKERLKPEEANELNLKRIEKIDFSGQIHLVENKPTKTGMIVVKKGDLVISGINVAKGALAVYEGNEDVIATIHYSSYSFDNEKIDINFLKWFLKSPAFVDALEEQTGGGIKTEIKAKKFLSLKILIPTLDEQKNIESNLNKFEEKYNKISEELQRQLGLISKLRSSILSDAVSGKLVLQDRNDESAEVLLEKIKAEKEKLIKEGKIKKQKPLPPINEDEIPYELPDGWVWCRFGKVATISSNLVNPYSYEDYPHIAPNNIEKHTGKLLDFNTVKDDSVKSSNHLFYSNQILYSKVRPLLNKVIIVDFIGLCSADMYPIDSFIYNKYLKFLMLSDLFLEQVSSVENRVKMPKINQGELNNLLLSIPPLEEQKRIVEKVEKLMSTCDALELEVQNSKTETEKLMQSVLKEAFK